MGRKIHLRDFASSNHIARNRDAHLRMLDAASDVVDALKVSIRATNSGSLVNNRVYKGIHMKDAVDTWVKPYSRPILTHHADGTGWSPAEDPKGRVTKAEFTQLRKGRAFENDFKRPADGAMGSGFITVEATITDEDAIQKILDGRYLTVSSSQTTNSMTCSICNTDWFEDFCGHRPGQTYEIEVGKGKKKTMKEFFCYGIAGPLVYRELSFVNVPAQVNAQVLGILEKDSEDNLNMSTWSNDNAIMGMALCDAEGHILKNLTDEREQEMAKEKKVHIEMPGVNDDEFVEDDEVAEGVVDEDAIDDEATPEDNDVAEDLETEETPASDSDEEPKDDDEDSDVAMSDEDFALAHIAKSIKDNGLWLNKDESGPVFDGETESADVGEDNHSHLVVLQKTEDGTIAGRTYATIGGAADHDHVIEGDFISEDTAEGETRDASAGDNHIHTFNVSQTTDEVDDEAVDALIEKLNVAIENDQDESITSEQREMLEMKDFCGPNRSFPVSDASHFTQIGLLTVRYKSDAATKARVMNTAERKAKKAGVELRTVVDEEETLESGVKGVEFVQGEASTVRDEAIEEMMLDHATTKAKVTSLEGSLAEKAQEIQALEDDLVREKAGRTEALANTLIIVRTILGKPDCKSVGNHDKFVAKVEEYAKRTPDSLWDAVNDLLPELDLTVRNLRKGKEPVIVPAADGHKAPQKRQDITNTGSGGASRRGPKDGAEQLSQDLDS